ELSEAAIVAAVKARRTVVLLRGPDDPRLEIAVRGANGAAVGIGDTASGISSIQGDAHVVGAAPGDGVALAVVRDREPADPVPVDSADFRKSFTYAARGGPERVRAELIADGARIVVTSHVYVDGATGGGGCAVGDGGCGWLAVAIAAAFVVRRRARH